MWGDEEQDTGWLVGVLGGLGGRSVRSRQAGSSPLHLLARASPTSPAQL